MVPRQYTNKWNHESRSTVVWGHKRAEKEPIEKGRASKERVMGYGINAPNIINLHKLLLKYKSFKAILIYTIGTHQNR